MSNETVIFQGGGSLQAQPVRERERLCKSCSGLGYLEFSREELKSYLENIFVMADRKPSLQKMLAAYREWKRERGEIRCPKCKGKKSWTEQY